MGLIWEILKTIANEDSKNNKLEKEMDNYGLDEEEKELVRKGEYEPYNFETSEDEELEEDDYYYFDDK